jgi:1-acyl-sn-glycerol-3-phosphate acyltransferase
MKVVQDILWKVRVLLFYFSIIVVSVLFLPVICCTQYIRTSYELQYKLARFYSRVLFLFLRIFCNIDTSVAGKDNIPKEPCVILANHQSFADNFLTVTIFPLKQSWIMKKELLTYPLLGPGLKALNPIAIDRGHRFSVRQIITQGIEKIKSGLSVVIYPEGTRVSPYVNAKFKPSGVKLAQEAQVPILMVAHNAGLLWPKGFWIKKPGTIKVTIAPIISKEECINTDVRLLNAQVEKWITDEKNRLIS